MVLGIKSRTSATERHVQPHRKLAVNCQVRATLLSSGVVRSVGNSGTGQLAGGIWKAQKVVPLAMNLSQSDCHSENDPDAGRVWEAPSSSHEAAAWDASQPEAALITSGRADENCINAESMGDPRTSVAACLSLAGERTCHWSRDPVPLVCNKETIYFRQENT